VRLRNLTLGLALILLASGVFAAPVMAKDPSISVLKQRLRHARQMQHRAHDRVTLAAANLAGARALAVTANVPDATAGGAALDPTTTADAPAVPAGMSPVLAATLLADGVVSTDEIAALQTRLAAAKRVAHRWNVKVRQLKQRVRRLQQIAEWNRRGQWKPLIEIACKKYGVSAGGLHRMMILESGGRRTVGTTYKGLFQYYPSTWSGSWNPWRHESIFNGWAQIRATAYAISRGMGPSQWPNTYPMAF
jgi:predicted flap endonuclease-1-like 5' DNA nuclease